MPVGDRARGWEKERPSDATFWADGTETRFAYRGPVQAWWWRLAGWKHAAVKLGTFAAAFASWQGMVHHPYTTTRITALLTGLAGGYALVKVVVWREEWEHARAVVRPLHHALAGVLDAPARPKDWLTVPMDYATNRDAEIVIRVPDDFTASDRDRDDVTRAVEAKLPRLEAPDADWSRLHGHRPRIV